MIIFSDLLCLGYEGIIIIIIIIIMGIMHCGEKIRSADYMFVR
jgi:hypothetical protein